MQGVDVYGRSLREDSTPGDGRGQGSTGGGGGYASHTRPSAPPPWTSPILPAYPISPAVHLARLARVPSRPARVNLHLSRSPRLLTPARRYRPSTLPRPRTPRLPVSALRTCAPTPRPPPARLCTRKLAAGTATLHAQRLDPTIGPEGKEGRRPPRRARAHARLAHRPFSPADGLHLPASTYPLPLPAYPTPHAPRPTPHAPRPTPVHFARLARPDLAPHVCAPSTHRAVLRSSLPFRLAQSLASPLRRPSRRLGRASCPWCSFTSTSPAHRMPPVRRPRRVHASVDLGRVPPV
ncbi:hypothetical protein B0H16DRAFT_1883643 [Mycena metata]|uniref:Uncharacterized protein n=1 Tax=Mycena metata TaxID=1033252 RepID=A0AAD7JG30_9AGAR|nr:hypothetical protein B0H16DRAFT_1883643 [Mycena metata]